MTSNPEKILGSAPSKKAQNHGPRRGRHRLASVVPGIRYQEHALSQKLDTRRTGAFIDPVADATDWRR